MLKTLSILLPNPSQAASLFRSGLQVLGAYLATKGLIDGDTWATVAGPLLVLTVVGYGSLYTRTTTNLVASAAALPEVSQIVAAPAIANAIPSAVVVSASDVVVTGAR